MYKRISTAIILAVIFIPIYANYIYAAEAKFKSEEELIDQTKTNVEKYLKSEEETKVVPVIKFKAAPPKVEEQAPVKEEKPAVIETKQTQSAPVVKTEPVPVVQEEPKQEIRQQPKQEPKKEVPEPVKAVTKNEVSPDVKTVDIEKPEEMDFPLKKKPVVETAMEQPVLKKMDVNKIGANPYYETYEGLRLLKYFTVAQRVEIYQEPRPIDSYILDAFAMRIIYPNTPWDQKADFRQQITPIFTRAYGTEIGFSDPKNKEGQIRYTHDYREIYRNYFPKYANIKEEMWDQNEILLMHAKVLEPINWLYTFNLGYRYSTMNAKDADPAQLNSYYEIRHTFFSALSLAPTPKTEYFFQEEYYKSMHVKSVYDYRPDHFLGRMEMRIKSDDYKTNFVPQFSYSKDFYYPFWNTFEKYEIAYRVGRDWTKRFSTTSTIQYVYSFRDEPDNQGPDLYGTSFKNPHEDKGEYISLENRFSYNIYDRLYIQTGLDFANGLNWSVFDNWGLLGGFEYYAPGMIRVDVGYRGNHYYNLDKFLSSVYFKFYLFM